MPDPTPRPAPRSLRLILIAIALSTASQFMNYAAPHTVTRPVVMLGVYVPTASGGVIGVPETVAGSSGWAIHRHAKFVLIALVLLFLLDPNLGPAWKRWRFWVATLALLCFCLFPYDLELQPGWGALVGLIAVIYAIRAARARTREAAPPVAPATPTASPDQPPEGAAV